MTGDNPDLIDGAILYQVSVWGRGGRIPTFVLNSAVQGIIHERHAAQIALSMFPDCDSVTVMSYATGQPVNVTRAELENAS